MSESRWELAREFEKEHEEQGVHVEFEYLPDDTVYLRKVRIDAGVQVSSFLIPVFVTGFSCNKDGGMGLPDKESLPFYECEIDKVVYTNNPKEPVDISFVFAYIRSNRICFSNPEAVVRARYAFAYATFNNMDSVSIYGNKIRDASYMFYHVRQLDPEPIPAVFGSGIELIYAESIDGLYSESRGIHLYVSVCDIIRRVMKNHGNVRGIFSGATDVTLTVGFEDNSDIQYFGKGFIFEGYNLIGVQVEIGTFDETIILLRKDIDSPAKLGMVQDFLCNLFRNRHNYYKLGYYEDGEFGFQHVDIHFKGVLTFKYDCEDCKLTIGVDEHLLDLELFNFSMKFRIVHDILKICISDNDVECRNDELFDTYGKIFKNNDIMSFTQSSLKRAILFN